MKTTYRQDCLQTSVIPFFDSAQSNKNNPGTAMIAMDIVKANINLVGSLRKDVARLEEEVVK